MSEKLSPKSPIFYQLDILNVTMKKTENILIY